MPSPPSWSMPPSRRPGVARRWRRPSSTSLPPSSTPTTVPTLGDVDCSQRRFLRLAGDVDRAFAVLREAPRRGALRRRAWRRPLRAGTHAARHDGEARRACNEALAVVGDDDARSSRILALRAGHHLLKADVSAALDSIREGLERAERTGDPALVAQVIAYAGQVETYHNEITPGLLERGDRDRGRARARARIVPQPTVRARPPSHAHRGCRRRSAVLERFAAEAHDRGDEVSREMALWPLAMLEWLAGRWEEASAHAAVAYELTVQTQHPQASSGSGGRKRSSRPISASSTRRARRRRGPLLDARVGSELYTNVAEAVLGRLELMLGNLEAAGGYLRELPGRLVTGGLNDPSFPLWADSFETLACLGELEPCPYTPRAVRAHCRPPARQPVGAGCRPTMPRSRCGCRRATSFGSSRRSSTLLQRAARSPLAVRARPDASLSSAQSGGRRSRSARPARTLEAGASRSFEELGARALGGEGSRRATRGSAAAGRASDELTETEHRVAVARRRGHRRTRRSPPRSTWARARSRRTSRVCIASSGSALGSV